MKNFLILFVFIVCTNVFAQTNNYHDTQGKIEISDNGQSVYTLPIAMPPSIQDVGPTINLVYSSGQLGGIAGQGWGISSISNISRVSTRIDIDGFVDGVDFDSNDKLAFDGQRLILVSGTYWADGSIYKTEVLSNSKIELKGSGASMYFIATSPDGSRAWYGNYGGMNATDLTAYYITRFEDTNGNFITYHYSKPFNKALCIGEIKFSANVNGVTTPFNAIKFNYRLAKRAESAYVKGLKHEKVEILDNVEVKTNNLLFRKYQLTHSIDPKLGYERVSQIQEFNAALEPANPVVFDYDTTVTTASGSETETYYSNNLYFNNIELSGDFDGDGRLDFIADNGLYRNLFQGSSGQAPLSLPSVLSTIRKEAKFSATTLQNDKLNQFNSIVAADETLHNISFKVYNYDQNNIINSYSKQILLENIGNNPNDIIVQTPIRPGSSLQPQYLKKTNEYLEGDFNGDGISEVLIVSTAAEFSSGSGRAITIGNWGYRYHLLDLNPNSSNVLDSKGFVKIQNSTLLDGYLNSVDNPKELMANTVKLFNRFVLDANGDGKSDVLIINDNKTYKIVTFNQLNVAPWIEAELIGEGTLDKYSKTKQILFGDYNGDGKMDIMIPDSEGGPNDSLWHIYYSNPKPTGGAFFEKESHNIVEYWPNTGSYYKTQTHFNRYYALDTNNDGKSDLVRVWYKYAKQNWTINNHDTNWEITTFANNTGNSQVTGVNKFTADYTSPSDHFSGSPDLIVPIVSNYRYAGLNRDMVVVHNHNNKAFYIDFSKDVSKDNRISKITSSGGNIVDEIEYAVMEPSSSNSGFGNMNEFYSSSNSVNYPFVEIKRIPTSYLVGKLKNSVNGVTRYQDFKYHGLQVHLHGLGSIGYKKTARSEWYQNATSKRLWTVTENRSDWRGATERVYVQLLNDGSNFTFVNSGNPAGIVNSSKNVFDTTFQNGNYKIWLKEKLSEDFISGVNTLVSYEYDPLYLLPEKMTTKNYTTSSSNPDATKTITTIFDNLPSGAGSNYYIGRPREINTLTAAYNDTFASKEKFSYLNNKLIKTEKKGNLGTGIDKYLVEEFGYNSIGNVIKKTIKSSGYIAPDAIVAPRIVEYTYDSTERFVKTIKDIEGLVSTNVSYHPLYGLVTESKSVYGLTTKTQFDNWGKAIKITDYLNKNVNISYTKSNNEYTVSKNGDDGSGSVEISDALGRIIKTGAKNINGDWTYKSVEYDIKGRKFKESEPYYNSPTLWTEYTFDDYNRILSTKTPTGLTTSLTYTGLTVSGTDGTKSTSSTKNANGHVISSSDNGEVITFKYYANGNLKESDYNGTKVKMKYDEWGRKTELDDPSAGTYNYKQNVLGEVYYEKTPNGLTEIEYDDFGKISQKKIVGLNTNSKETYTYDTISKLITKLRFDDVQNGTFTVNNYGYDNYKRLNFKDESGFLAYFQQAIQFDAFGRPEKQLYTAINTSDNKRSDKWVRNTYKNGFHWQILDDATNQILWQTNNVNERGQLTTANYGNGIGLNQGYDQFGYLQHSRHFNVMVTPVVDVLNLYTTFEQQRGNLKSRTNSLFNWTENFDYDSFDRLAKYTNAQGIQVEQVYEQDGRIKENTNGKYNYSNNAKKYQNTSIDITAEAKAYYSNREGVFNDAMEQKSGWQIYEPSVFSFDATVSHTTGNSSLKIANTSATEKVVHSENWIAIDNAVPTEYTYSAWVKSDGTNPEAEIFLFMKTANETGYFTLVDQKVSATSTGWTQIEKTFLVPANIKKINIRLDNNNVGNLWFDDVHIRRTSNATSSQRELNISYNTWKSPYEIEETGVDRISFSYNHMNNRSSMFYGGLETDKMQRQFRKHYAADGSMEIKHNRATGAVEFVTYIGGDGYSAPVVLKSDGTTQEYLYLHRDYLGSIVAITNQAGTVVEKRLFDAWGDIIKIVDAQGTVLTNFAVLDRGYTGHEHLQSVGLVHMNGRLYDAKLHRFLQPDNYIQDPYNSQNYNRYGYVLNNPLKYSDPSGEEFTLLGAVIVGTVVAITSYTITALVSDVPFNIQGALLSAAVGATTSAVTFGIGSAASTISNFYLRAGVQAVAHGTFQGTMSELQGGTFISGFASGSLSSIASSAFMGGSSFESDGCEIDGSGWQGAGKFSQSTVGTLAFGTIAGGAGASLTGGNFWQGAATGLIVSGLNHLAHKVFVKTLKGYVLINDEYDLGDEIEIKLFYEYNTRSKDLTITEKSINRTVAFATLTQDPIIMESVTELNYNMTLHRYGDSIENVIHFRVKVGGPSIGFQKASIKVADYILNYKIGLTFMQNLNKGFENSYRMYGAVRDYSMNNGWVASLPNLQIKSFTGKRYE